MSRQVCTEKRLTALNVQFYAEKGEKIWMN